jgi:hypothetical protein
MQRFGLAFGLVLLLSGCGDANVPPETMCTGVPVNNMVWVPGGSFVMGGDPHYAEEGPPQTVAVAGFWIDTHGGAGSWGRTGEIPPARKSPLLAATTNPLSRSPIRMPKPMRNGRARNCRARRNGNMLQAAVRWRCQNPLMRRASRKRTIIKVYSRSKTSTPTAISVARRWVVSNRTDTVCMI